MIRWMWDDRQTFCRSVKPGSGLHLRVNSANSTARESSIVQVWDRPCVKSRIASLHSDAAALASARPVSHVSEQPSWSEDWLIDHTNGKGWWSPLTLPVRTAVVGRWVGTLGGIRSMTVFGLSRAMFRSLAGSARRVVLLWLIWERVWSQTEGWSSVCTRWPIKVVSRYKCTMSIGHASSARGSTSTAGKQSESGTLRVTTRD